MLPQLSHYTQFYVALGHMVKSEEITVEQKGLLKAQLLKKDPKLVDLMLAFSGQGK
jgi:cAMP-specific phosphodiesterase 4